jgi:hypothetical protein
MSNRIARRTSPERGCWSAVPFALALLLTCCGDPGGDSKPADAAKAVATDRASTAAAQAPGRESAAAARPPARGAAADDSPPPIAPKELACLYGTPFLDKEHPLAHRPVTALAVRRETLDFSRSWYVDLYADKDSNSPGNTKEPEAVWLSDGELLVSLGPTGEWYENSSVWLQLHVGPRSCTLMSVHMSWSADVSPMSAWCAILEGELVLDDSRLATGHVLRGRFRIVGGVPYPAEAKAAPTNSSTDSSQVASSPSAGDEAAPALVPHPLKAVRGEFVLPLADVPHVPGPRPALPDAFQALARARAAAAAAAAPPGSADPPAGAPPEVK